MTPTTSRVVAYLPMRGTIFRSVGFNAFQDLPQYMHYQNILDWSSVRAEN